MNCQECLFIHNCSFYRIGITYCCPRNRTADIMITDEFPERCVGILRFSPKKIIHNGPATIVFWTDGSKTVVKCAAGTDPDLYNAFCAAFAKKVFGTNSRLKKRMTTGGRKMNLENIKLNPCPFCGGEALLIIEDCILIIEDCNGDSTQNIRRAEFAYCQCKNCGATAQGEYRNIEYSAIKRVVEKWNRRDNPNDGLPKEDI